MPETAIATAMLSIASLVGLGTLRFVVRPRHCVEFFRQEVFELRDRLFIDAANGLVGFDHPAYVALRTTMNGYILMAHRMTYVHLLLLLLLVRRRDIEKCGPFDRRFQDAVANVPDQARARLLEYRLRMDVLMLKHVVRSSLVLSALIVPVRAARVSQRVREAISTPVRKLDDIAYVDGMQAHAA